MRPSLQLLALGDRPLALTHDLVGRQQWPHQPSTGTRTAEVDQKAYLDISDSRFG